MNDFAERRLNMVESQLRTNKVTDHRILRAMGELPREGFLPSSLRGVAYVDEDLPLGRERYAMEPLVLARLIQAASIQPNDVVLEVGSGCGYGTALLARLANVVVGIESDAALAEQANRILSELGVDNAAIVNTAMAQGHPAQAPYDVIVVAGAMATLPRALTDQLRHGGRLVGVLQPPGEPGRAILVRRGAGTALPQVLFDAATPTLPGFAPQPDFVF
jgi:protein-L-isoaspartate(D-aspartate) O-methyltransferase